LGSLGGGGVIIGQSNWLVTKKIKFKFELGRAPHLINRRGD
jgi:hypothetical protein